MKTLEILNNQDLAVNIADAVSYNVITGDESLLVHIKSGEFKMVGQDRVGYMVANQGWTECVSRDNMVNILGLGDTSEDGLIEGEKIATWMRSQA